MHIEANHGEEIRKAGFSSVNDFVSFIAHNYDKDNIRVGKRRHNGNITYLLQVTDSHDNTLFIEMSRDGSYWNVNSAGVFRKKYSNKKETVVKTEPQQPNNAISAGSSLSENEESGITSSEPNGEPPVSNSKYSKESPNVQEPPVHRTGEEAGSRDIIDMTEEELAEIRAKEREKIDRIFGKEYLDNVAKAVEKRKAERKAVVSKAAKELRSELTASPDIVLVSDLKDIPEEDLQGKTPQEAIRRMRAKGWYTPGNGKVYINLSVHSTAEDVKATILHEAVAHKGLRALLGEESFGALCDAVYRSMPKKRQKAYEDTYKKIYPNTAEAELRRIIADEYMARLAEGGVRQSIPQRIISAIREFLRSIGIDLDINDADIRHMLAQSYKNMQEADAVTVLDNSALLARLRKAAEETHIKSEAESLFRLGKKSRDAYERLLEEKRPDMPDAMRQEALNYLDNLEDSKANTKKIKIAVKWLADGTIRLPEDADKVDMAIEYANRKGIDAMQYKSPLDLIDALKGHVEIKDKPIDPDTVKELTNKVEYGDGLTVYEVENSEAGRQAMRRIINTHFGKDASPWCLLQGDSNGNLTSQSAQYWKHYDAYPKRVAFKDGKLLAFFANDEDTPVWWDRLDRPNYDGIPVTGKIKGDPLGRTATRMFDENTKTYGQPLDIHKGNKRNGTYEAWHPNGQMRVRAHYKNGIPVGNYESWYENGNPLVKISYNEKGEYDGLYEDWYENGQPHSRSNFKGDMVDGLSEDWYEDGQLKERCNYKDGNLDGLRELWYDDGQPLLRENYKDNKKDGLCEKWNFDGEQISKELYENGELKAFLPLDDSAEDVRFRIREDAPPQKTGIGYKVFVLKNGKLYPPMVANPNGADTPIGVWLDADAAPITGQSKTGRNQVKAGGKGTQGGSGKLAFRPGWHLGEIPYALQFNRIDETGVKSLFPRNFVWAEVEYANDVDYQDEARSYGINANGKYQHSLAGLPRIPVNGSYKYRTNPNPETDPWIITGAIKINRLLTPSEVDEMVKNAGKEPQRRQSGSITDDEVMQINKENMLSLDDDADIRFRMDNDLEEVNRRFNEELERYQQGKTSKNEMFHLGLPNGVMSIFLPNLPIVMRQRVVNKGANKKHNVEVSSIINMPQKISEPIFVFKKDDKSLSILSEMKDKIGRNVFVAFDLSSEIQDGGRYIEVNDVTTVHGRRIENIIRPINENNSLQWVDKKKALEWFSSASPNVQQEITSQELKTASNIIKNFENPNSETGKNTEDIRSRMDNEAHLKSLAVTPQLIENAIFIDELPNEKGNGKYDSYRYYVCGLKIGGVDYTVKVTIGVKQGKRYYDHSLTEIEKGNLYEIANGFTSTGGAPVPSSAEYKDKRLLSLLQTNSSKVVDENGEPRVVYHGTNESFLSFDRNKAGISRNTCERQGRIGRNIWQKFFPERIRDSQKADGGKNGRINNLENKKSYSHRRKSYKNDAYFGFEQNFQHQR